MPSHITKIIKLVETWSEDGKPQRLCFAIPGETCIDEVNPQTGLSLIRGETLAEIQARYPRAEAMTLDDYCASKAAKQDTPVVWEPSTAEEYDEMLGCLPPAIHLDRGFLVGEPFDHHAGTGAPRYSAFRKIGREYFRANRPMTCAEFRKALA